MSKLLTTLCLLALALDAESATTNFMKVSTGVASYWAELSAPAPPPASPTTSLRAYVDPIYGSDGSGEIGNIDAPYLTITNAVLAANAYGANGTNVVIMLAPHTNYNIGIVSLNLTNNVSIRGAGRYASVILGGGSGTTNSPIIQPGDNSSIEDLSIVNNRSIEPDDIGEATIGFKSTSANQDATNVIVRNCFLGSGSDGVYISTTGRVEITFIDCEMVGLWDVVATIGNTAFDHVLNFYNCDMKSDQRNRYGTNGAPSQVIFADNGIVNVYGGSITLIATNGAQHSAIRARASNGTINMAGGTRFEVDIPGADLILRNDGGGRITSQNTLERDQISGAVAWLTTNIVASSVTASGVLTLNATNEVIVATGGGQGGIVISNALPRIKLQRTDGASAGWFRSLALGQFEIEIENTGLSMNWNTNGLTYIEMMSIANMSTNVAFKIKSASANGPYDVINILTNGTILTASSNVSDIGTALLPYRTNYAKAFTVVGSTKTVAYAENGLVHLDADRFRLAGANPITTNLTIAGLATLHITNGLIMAVTGP